MKKLPTSLSINIKSVVSATHKEHIDNALSAVMWECQAALLMKLIGIQRLEAQDLQNRIRLSPSTIAQDWNWGSARAKTTLKAEHLSRLGKSARLITEMQQTNLRRVITENIRSRDRRSRHYANINGRSLWYLGSNIASVQSATWNKNWPPFGLRKTYSEVRPQVCGQSHLKIFSAHTGEWNLYRV